MLSHLIQPLVALLLKKPKVGPLATYIALLFSPSLNVKFVFYSTPILSKNIIS